MGDPELAGMFTVGLIAMILLSSESEKEFWMYVIGLGVALVGFLVLLSAL